MTDTGFTYDQDIVIDSQTGLMWQRNVAEERFNPENAKQYAAKLRLGGFSVWRVPTKEELESIVDHSKYGPAIDTTAFPNTPSGLFWTVSPNAYFSSYAWVVNFSNGHSDYSDVRYSYRVRCVR